MLHRTLIVTVLAVLAAFAVDGVVESATTIGRTHALQPSPGEPHAVTAVACYVALANDLTPLLHPGAPDAAAESPECVSLEAISGERRPGTSSRDRPRRATDTRLQRVSVVVAGNSRTT